MDNYNIQTNYIGKMRVTLFALFLTLLIFSFFLSSSVMVTSSIKQLTKEVNSDVSAYISIKDDYETLYEDDITNAPNISLDRQTIETIGSSKYVDYYDMSFVFFHSEIKNIPFGDEDSPIVSFVNEYLGLRGTTATEITQLEDNNAVLLRGSLFTKEDIKNGSNKVLIYEDFANYNNLDVGDTFKITDTVYDILSDAYYDDRDNAQVIASLDYEVEVIGILGYTGTRYEHEDNFDETYPFEYLDTYGSYMFTLNRIYTPVNFKNDVWYKQYEEYKSFYGDKYEEEPVYVVNFMLKDIKYINDFIEENNHYLPKYLKFASDISENETIMKPVNKMNKLFVNVFITSIIGCIVIISLLVTLFLKENKKEISNNLSITNCKTKLIRQMITKLLLIVIIAVTLSLPFAYRASSNISTKILNENAEYDYVNNHHSINDYYDTTNYLENNYTVNLSITTILLVYLAAIITTLLSCIIPSIYINKLDDKKNK